MTAALVALGSNLDDRQAMLDRAIATIAARPNVRLISASRPHATRPVGGPPSQAEFLNAAALFETSLAPGEFLSVLQKVEQTLGRVRDGRLWAARPIDLDLLLFGSETIDRPDLIVPHPRMAFRRFVIEAAAEIAPDMRHPTVLWTLAELRNHLRGAIPYVAIVGAPGAGKTELASDVAAWLGIARLTDPRKKLLLESGNAAATGPAWQREIELLDARTAQLSEAFAADRQPINPAALGGKSAISDYWIEQAVCYADLALPPERVGEFRKHWSAVVANVVRPKLLVLLDAPAEWLLRRADAADLQANCGTLSALAELRQKIIDRAYEPGRGPLLRLDASDTENARIELTAAIQAMT